MQSTKTLTKTKKRVKKVVESINLSRFSQPLRTAIENARKVAILSRAYEVMPKHIFAALLLDKESLAFFLLDKLNLDAEETIKRLTGISAERLEMLQRVSKKKITLSGKTKDLLLDSLRIAKEGKSHYIGTEHVLLAFLRNKDSQYTFVTDLVASIQSLPNFVNEVLRATTTPFELLKQAESFISAPTKPLPPMPTENGEAILEQFTELLTHRLRKFPHAAIAAQKKKYSDKVLTGLLRKNNQNILLVGPNGIGKSLVVDEVVYRIVSGDVPLSLRGLKIYKLNTAAVIASAKFPGEMDKQIMAVLNEIYGQEDAVLYIDDFNVLANSPMKGGLSMGTSMKIFLENNGVRLIATLNDEDYRAFIESNRSVARFFNVIEMEEPSTEDTVIIMKNSVKEIEKNHNVKIHPSAIDTAVKLSSSYIPDRVLPEKAIEILDIAASQKKYDQEYSFRGLGELLTAQKELDDTKDRLTVLGDFEGAEVLKKRQQDVEKQIKQMQRDLKKEGKNRQIIIDENDIKQIISQVTKLPLSTVSNDETSMLLKLEGVIKDHIISQEDAIRRVASAVKRGRVGISNKRRPWASLLFLGPTGVGKTELAKVLSRTLFGDDEEKLIQIDMSEYMEMHSVSKLIGSPPGYIGFEQGGYLTEKIAENPYSVVLFDEIEKAHPDVLNILLQILEDGHLTDSRGSRVSFQNAIIILTSNIGAEKITEQRIVGFYRDRASIDNTLSEGDYEEMKEKLLKELKKKLRPELINRLDDVIIFKSLTKEDAAKVLDILLSDLNKRLEDINVKVNVLEAGKEFLLEGGFNNEYGARPLRRILQHEVEDIIADFVLEKGLLEAKKEQGKVVNISMTHDKKVNKLVVVN